MSCHLLGDLTPTAVLKVLGYPGRPKRVISNPCLDARCERAPPDHPMHIGLRHGIAREHSRLVSRSSK